MKTRLLGLAVVVVALAATINALAYKTAEVTNKVTLNIVNTTAAELAFSSPTTPDPGLTIDTATNGYLEITANDDIQRNASYTWSQAFKITNNAGYAVDLTYSAAGFPAGATVTLLNDATGLDISGLSLAAGNNINVNLKIQTNDTVALGGPTAYNLVVTGTRP